MAIEFNGKGKINELKVSAELPKQQNQVKEEKKVEQQIQIDNKFVKEFGAELLTANAVNNYGVKINKLEGEKIDKEFWGDTLDGLNLKDTAIAIETKQGINQLNNTFAMIDMENKMAKSPFMQALNKEFDI